MAAPKRIATKPVRVDVEVDALVLKHQRPRETWNECLRRLLGLDEERADKGARGTRRERLAS